MESSLSSVIEVTRPRLLGEGAVTPLATMKNRLPLVVGVTGHRYLDENDEAAKKTAVELKSAVKDYFRKLRRDCPHTPILLISPLAEGADQLVAGAALELRDDPDQPLHVELLVPLPMPEKIYLQDFQGEEHAAARAEYHRLSKLASRTIEMPLLSDEKDFDDPGKSEQARQIQYLLVGTFVARHCHIWVALWDRKDEQGIGGTGQIVRFKRTGSLALTDAVRKRLESAREPFGLRSDPLDMPETGPVVHFPVPGRKGCPVPEPYQPEELAPQSYYRKGSVAHDEKADAAERHQYFQRFDQIHKENLDEFNQLAEELERDESKVVERDKRDKEAENSLPGAELDRCHLPESLRAVRDTYATADRLAIDLKARLDWMLSRVVLLILLAVVLFAAYAHLTQGFLSYMLLAFYLISLAWADRFYLVEIKGEELLRIAYRIKIKGEELLGITRNYWSERRPRLRGHDDQNRFQDYRTLCEGLRVQLYWRLAGMGQLVSDYYLMRQKNELDWIRSAVRAWGLLAEPAAPGDPPGSIPDDRRDLIRKKWVLGQLNYYISASYRDRILDLVFSQLAGGFLVASLATSFVVAFVKFYFYHPTNVPRWVAIVVVVFVLLIIVVAVFVLLIIAAHAVAKFVETDREAREDQDEITQIDSIAQDQPEIEPAKELPKFLKHAPFWPLYRLLGGDGAVRPGMRRVSWFSFFYGLVAGTAITLFLLGMSLLLHYTLGENLWVQKNLHLERMDWMIVAMVLNVAIAALLQWYTEKQAFGSHYRQYKKMKTTFLVAYNALHPRNAGEGTVAPQTALTRLGNQALAEHADWLLMHRERPLELPRLEL